jgi:hypothetical protein
MFNSIKSASLTIMFCLVFQVHSVMAKEKTYCGFSGIREENTLAAHGDPYVTAETYLVTTDADGQPAYSSATVCFVGNSTVLVAVTVKGKKKALVFPRKRYW